MPSDSSAGAAAFTPPPFRPSHPTGHPPAPLRPPLELFCVALIALAAAALRWLHLTSQGFNLDEGFSVEFASLPAPDFLQALQTIERNMILYHSLLRVWMQLGHSEFFIRSLSVIFGTATVPVLYLLARRLFPDPWVALTSALLLALHPFHLMLSQSARSYSLVVFLVTLASLFFVRGLQQPSWGNWGLYSLFSAAAIYSHLFALLVIAAHVVALAFLPRRVPWKYWAFAMAALLALCVPLAVVMLHHPSAGQIAWVPPLNRRQLAALLYSLTLSKARALTYVVAWGVALVHAVRSSRDSGWPCRFVALWWLLPVAVTLLVSTVHPLLVDRYLSVCIPAAALLAAAGVEIVARQRTWAAALLLALLVFYSASNIRHYWHHPEYSETWREASAYLLSHAHSGDEVVLTPFARPTFNYYRNAYPGAVPALLFASSASDPLPAPPPQSIWFIGSVLLTPDWADEADVFRQAQSGHYCAPPVQPDLGSVRVWQFKRCDAEASTPERPSPIVR